VLLAHHRELVEALREPTATDPWRVLVSGCLAGWQCGVDGSDYGLGVTLAELSELVTFRALPFCPEQTALGTPRTMPDIHGGDGVDVIEGRARVLDQHGADLTNQMLDGARQMLNADDVWWLQGICRRLRQRVRWPTTSSLSAVCGHC
jgi:uncharacterized protein YbbK (DUF523 family)